MKLLRLKYGSGKSIELNVLGRLRSYYKKLRILRSYAGLNKSFNINYFTHIFIDPAFNICNLQCLYCPVGQGLKIDDNPPGYLKLEGFKDICTKSLKEYKGILCLYNWGESFLNPEIVEMVEFAKNNTKARVMLNSNFSFNHDNQIQRILNTLKDDIIIISCDGFSQATCEKYRKNVDFDKVMHNIIVINKNKKLETRLTWQYLEFPWNLDEIKHAEEYCRNNNIIFYAQKGGITPNYPLMPSPRTHNERIFRCGLFLESLTINYDGNVYPCCGYFGPKRFSIGNAKENSLEEIFVNGKGKDMVDYLTYKSEGNDNLICKHCIERIIGCLNIGYSKDA